MHWGSIRYCIGFPPELWYDIADEEGFLIQDEFPIWIGDATKPGPPGIDRPKADKLIAEYTEWMRERWNHPCAAIWDASNETFTPETVQAIQAVRHLDLSNRPWDNGWSEPQCPTDVAECHPYLFVRLSGWDGQTSFHLRELETMPTTPELVEWTPAEPKFGCPSHQESAGDHQRVRLLMAQPQRQHDGYDR